MTGLIIVSHSQKLAEGVVDFISQMAPNTPVLAAGGLEDGSLGTSYEKIFTAIETLQEQVEDVLLFADIGSSIMTIEMVLEDLGDEHVQFVDAPLVEGSFVAAVQAQAHTPIHKIIEEIHHWNKK